MKAAYIYTVFLLFCSYAKAQVFPELKFSHITEKEGLSNNRVVMINQDGDGFIWASTIDGLNRLDGYRVKTFFHNPSDAGSVINNRIIGTAADSAGNLWVTTAEGVNYYSKKESRFINLPASVYSKKQAGIYKDAEGIIWIIKGDSIFSTRNNIQRQAYAVYFNNLPLPIKTETPGYTHLYQDREGAYWITASNWILSLDSKTKQVERAYKTPGNITGIYQDVTMHFWLATFGNGLLLFNKQDGSSKKIELCNNADIVYSICEWKDKNGAQWLVIGTDKGLVLLDQATMHNYCYTNNTYDDYALHGDRVFDVFKDKENILWLSTNNGINYIEPSRQLIQAWGIYGDSSVSDEGKQGYVFSFCIDSGGYWAGNWTRPGLIFYNKNGSLVKIIPNLYPANPDSLRDWTDRPFDIIKQNDGTLWCSTEMGLVHFDPKSRTSQLYKPAATSRVGFRTILPYNDSIWWVRTRNNAANGIYVFNNIQKKFIAHYLVRSCDTCPPLRLFDILITKNKVIYAAPFANTLYRFNTIENKFVPVNIQGLNTGVTGYYFECMAEGEDGEMWIGTLNGLFAFNPATGSLIKDYSADGKIGGVEISRLSFDDNQNLWVATNRGLFCIVKKSGEILQFNTTDGLPSNTIHGFLINGKDGYMYAGAVGYTIKFKPEALLMHKISGEVHFSEITVMDKPYPIQQDRMGNNSIVLTPGQDFLTVDYTVVNYDNPGGNRYFYRLEGAGNEWKESETGHLSFYNLPAGKYTLHMQGGHKYSERFNSEAILYIQVMPFWWQTIAFRLLVALLAVVLIIFLVMRRINTIKKEAGLRQKITETEMAALRAQMNPHFIFNCLNSIDNLIQNNQKEKATTYLSKFAKLIRAILENSTFEMIPCWKELECLQLYVDLEMLRLGEKFSYKIVVDDKIYKGDYEMPPTILQPFVENAIHHGLHNKLDGSKTLTITMETIGNNIKCTIEDNGIGRKQAEVYKDINNPKHQSLGIKMTSGRIYNFNHDVDDNNGSIIITDLYENGVAGGTKVEILLKN